MPITNRRFHIGPDDDPDKYQLLRHVGTGGEAELWEADMALGGGRERVAVKILNPNHDGELDTWRQRWAEQVDLLRLVKHPGVVGVHHHFEGARMHLPGEADFDQRVLCLVMQWVDGQDLRAWVPQHAGVQHRHDALRHLGQVAAILDWLHSGKATTTGRPVIHGDISPANVVIDQDGQAVLVDFGFARIARRVTAMVAGTPGYCAPEVLRHGEYGPASDRYAFGALACYMLTGVHPPTDPIRLRAGLTTIAGPLADPSTIDQLMTIFAEDPDSRPPAGEWIRLLQLQSSTAPAVSAPLPPLAPPANPAGAAAKSRIAGLRSWVVRRPGRATAAVALISATLVAVLLTTTVFRPDEEDPKLNGVSGPDSKPSSVTAAPHHSRFVQRGSGSDPKPVSVAVAGGAHTGCHDVLDGCRTGQFAGRLDT